MLVSHIVPSVPQAAVAEGLHSHPPISADFQSIVADLAGLMAPGGVESPAKAGTELPVEDGKILPGDVSSLAINAAAHEQDQTLHCYALFAMPGGADGVRLPLGCVENLEGSSNPRQPGTPGLAQERLDPRSSCLTGSKPGVETVPEQLGSFDACSDLADALASNRTQGLGVYSLGRGDEGRGVLVDLSRPTGLLSSLPGEVSTPQCLAFEPMTSAQAPTPAPAALNAPHQRDAAQILRQLVDDLAFARETLSPRAGQLVIEHQEFGAVSLRFEARPLELTVAISAEDPALQRAITAAASTDARFGQSEQRDASSNPSASPGQRSSHDKDGQRRDAPESGWHASHKADPDQTTDSNAAARARSVAVYA